MSQITSKKINTKISKSTLLKAFELMATAKSLTEKYEENVKFISKYVHATSRGHEAIQIALGMQLLPQDYLSAYYRDDAILLSIGCSPYELMLQLMAKKDDPFSAGRTYYSHPSLNDDHRPKIPHQSSATGMQAIPSTGIALGIQYKELQGLAEKFDQKPIVVCSLGDGCLTEGEVSEAFHMADLKKLPIMYLVQDNEWDISAHASEIRASDAIDFVKGFPGIKAYSINGTNFLKCYEMIKKVIAYIRKYRKPVLIHAKVPLLNHHTSGVRKEWYRDDIEKHSSFDPYPFFQKQLFEIGISPKEIIALENKAKKLVDDEYRKAKNAEDPKPEDLFTHDFAPALFTTEKGERTPKNGTKEVMVDCALHAIQEIMEKHPESLLYGQDVGGRLGGVFREATNLAHKFGNNRVFNTPIQEAFIIGSTVGMSNVGLRPFVEVQFADYIWPGLNQLFVEVSRSCYLTNGKWPVSMVLRVPTGAYGSGGPYHSSSVESVLTNIRGIKMVYPSNGADMKGLMKAAYYEPNPVIIFEHKGLYWSKVEGTNAAKTVEPDADYIVPLGKARIALSASEEALQNGESMAIITYGIGVHWALNAAKKYKGKIEIVDLRSLYPLDTDTIFEVVKKHGKCLVITEEPVNNSFAQSIAARIQENCFEYLDAPVKTIGSENMPAIPLNSILEKTMILSTEKVIKVINLMLEE